MDGQLIGEFVLAGIMGVMGYFVKVLHGDVRRNTERVGENKGKIDNLNTQIEHEREMRNEALNNIMNLLGEIREDVKNLKK